MRRYERLVFGTALRILGRPEDARDVAQEVFLRLHRYAGSLDPERPLAPWFYRVTINACRDAGRRNAATPIAVPDADLERVGGGVEGGAEAGVLAGQRRRLLRRALQQLPERERQALVLRDVEGLATADVARTLGTSEVTVRTQVSRGRVKLKHLVDRMLKGTRP